MAVSSALVRAVRGWSEPERIVVVDDDDALRLLVGTVLELDGRFTVVDTAASAAHAAVVVARQRPDAVLLDITLPDLQGVEVLSRVHAAYPPARIVVFTGWCEADMEKRILEAGAAAMVLKGDHTRDLINALLPPEEPQRALVWALGPAASSGREAQRLAHSGCTEWGVDEFADLAGLVAREMVINAVAHVGSAVELSLRLRDDTVRVAVRERGTARADDPSPIAEGSRLDAIGDHAMVWGIDSTPDGKVVWADLLPDRSGGVVERNDFAPGTAVEVQNLADGKWANGYVVARVNDFGYWLERGDRVRLPALVPRRRVRETPPT